MQFLDTFSAISQPAAPRPAGQPAGAAQGTAVGGTASSAFAALLTRLGGLSATAQGAGMAQGLLKPLGEELTHQIRAALKQVEDSTGAQGQALAALQCLMQSLLNPQTQNLQSQTPQSLGGTSPTDAATAIQDALTSATPEVRAGLTAEINALLGKLDKAEGGLTGADPATLAAGDEPQGAAQARGILNGLLKGLQSATDTAAGGGQSAALQALTLSQSQNTVQNTALNQTQSLSQAQALSAASAQPRPQVDLNAALASKAEIPTLQEKVADQDEADASGALGKPALSGGKATTTAVTGENAPNPVLDAAAGAKERLARQDQDATGARGQGFEAAFDAVTPAATQDTGAGTTAAATLLAAVPTTSAAYNPATGTPAAVAQLAAQMVARLEGRSTRFNIELHPADLGRVDVQMRIAQDGRLNAQLAFDNPAAAADFRGRTDELRRSLEQAGFQLTDDSLSFAHSGGSGAGQGQTFDREFSRGGRDASASGGSRAFRDSELNAQVADAAQRLSDRNAVGVDMRV